MKKKTAAKSQDQSLRIMFTCVGRRVELVRSFQRAAAGLQIDLDVHGADATMLTPAMRLVDRPHVVPSIASGEYIEALLNVVRKHEIKMLIPLLDLELPHIAGARERFAEAGCTAVISSPAVIDVCQDKLATYRALRAAGIDTPDTVPWVAVVDEKKHGFPYYMKPRRGSAAKGNYVIRDADELRVLGRRVPDAIVQEFVEGAEYTLDVYTGFDGKPRCVIPRKRLEVRSGEVSKGLVVLNPAIMEVGRRVAHMLRDCRGVITVQCIATSKSQIRVIEMNARFGGGVPLAIRAGADFPRWLMEEYLGRKPLIQPDTFKDGVSMLRYDESVFVEPAPRKPKVDKVQAAKPAVQRKKKSRPVPRRGKRR